MKPSFVNPTTSGAAMRLLVAVMLSSSFTAAHAAAWQPTKAVEIVVPAGAGGAADQMARVIQGIVAKHQLMKQPVIVQNKSGASGGEVNEYIDSDNWPAIS